MGLGELIDRSVNFWRANWKPLFQLMLGFQLVEFTLVALSQTLARWLFPLARDPEAIQHAPGTALPDLLGTSALMTGAVLGSLLVAQVAGVATTYFAFTRVTAKGQPTSGDAFRHAAARLGTTTGAFALSMAWSLVVMMLLLLPGLALGTGAVFLGVGGQKVGAVIVGVLAAVALVLATVVLVVWFLIRFILVSQIIAMEPVKALAAFRRADALSSGRVELGAIGLVKLRLTVLVTIMGGLLLIVSTVASMPLLIAGGLYGAGISAGHTLTDVVPLAVMVPLQLVQTVLGALVAPLYIIFQTFFYADMRARREGLDLELALAASAA